jgi:hypothetical protein
MACNVYLEDGIIRIDFSAVVSTRDFSELTPTVEALERTTDTVPHRITDFSQSEGMNVGFPEIMALAVRRKAQHFPNSFKSAVVAPQPVQVGIARMFQMLNDHPKITIEVFPDLPSALAWLAAP